jgi:hypothetical protein
MVSSRISGLIIFSFLAIHFTSCKPHGDFSAESRSLDSLSVSLDSAASHLRTFDGTVWSAMADTIENQMGYIYQNFRGEMTKDMAAVMSFYRTDKKLAGRMVAKLNELNTGVVTSKKQMSDLVQALKDGATHDAQGNKMNDEYVNQAIASERGTAGNLIKDIQLMEENVQRLNTSYNDCYPKIKHWVDSIPAFIPKK